MNFPMQLSMFDYSKSYFLPVQALRDPAMEFVLNIESLYELLEVDSETNGLSKTIQFVEDPDRLKNIAEIKEVDGKQQIQISLNFCQFVWAVGLYMITYFDNYVQIPFMDAMGCNTHGRKQNPMEMEFANDSFMRARVMLQKLNRETFSTSPIYVIQGQAKLTTGNDNENLYPWEPNEKDGKFLLNEILLSGNFGNYDERLPQHRNKWQSFWMLSVHNQRLFRFTYDDWF